MSTPNLTDIFASPGLPPCLPCCVVPVPVPCSCALLIPVNAGPYGSYAAAAAAIAAGVSDCLGFYEPTGNTGNTFAASFNGTTLHLNGATAVSGPPADLVIHFYASVSLKSGAVVSVAYAITTDGSPTQEDVELLDCHGASLGISATSPSASGTLTVTAPADGEYIIHIGSQAGGGTNNATTLSATNAITSSLAWWVNPVIAQWDDSGTTRNLWACPKLLLPTMTESTGTWFASCAAAAAVLTDPLQVSNCVGYQNSSGSGISSFTATDGGTSLTLHCTFPPGGFSSPDMWGSVNAVAGKTLTFSFTNDATTPDANALILDDKGNIIEVIPGSTSPKISSPLPYTGRYSVIFNCGDLSGLNTLTFVNVVITSSGTMSVNPVQARYDAGLTCSGNLDCGDSCP